MLEIIIPAVGGITAAGYLLRHHAYGLVLDRSTKLLRPSELTRYKKLLASYEDRLPKGKAKSLLAQLHLLDVASGSTDTLKEKIFLPFPQKHEALPEPKKESESVFHTLSTIKRSRGGHPFTPDEVLEYYHKDRRLGFTAFLMALNMDYDSIRRYESYYPLLLKANREVISNIPEVVHSLVSQSLSGRFRVVASLKHTFDTTIQHFENEEEEKKNHTVETFMSLLEEPDELPPDPSLIDSPEPVPTVTSLPSFDHTQLCESNLITFDLPRFMKRTSSTRYDICFYMSRLIMRRNFPNMSPSGPEQLLETILHSSTHVKIDTLFTDSYLSIKNMDSDTLHSLSTYISSTYLPNSLISDSFLFYHNKTYYVVTFPKNYVFETSIQGDADV